MEVAEEAKSVAAPDLNPLEEIPAPDEVVVADDASKTQDGLALGSVVAPKPPPAVDHDAALPAAVDGVEEETGGCADLEEKLNSPAALAVVGSAVSAAPNREMTLAARVVAGVVPVAVADVKGAVSDKEATGSGAALKPKPEEAAAVDLSVDAADVIIEATDGATLGSDVAPEARPDDATAIPEAIAVTEKVEAKGAKRQKPKPVPERRRTRSSSRNR